MCDLGGGDKKGEGAVGSLKGETKDNWQRLEGISGMRMDRKEAWLGSYFDWNIIYDKYYQLNHISIRIKILELTENAGQ